MSGARGMMRTRITLMLGVFSFFFALLASWEDGCWMHQHNHERCFNGMRTMRCRQIDWSTDILHVLVGYGNLPRFLLSSHTMSAAVGAMCFQTRDFQKKCGVMDSQ
ncbi:hypothetical protein HOY82DRAFT_296631 [Tuber indicum]|nr:hypothetical protein HOY82DRAFT_296631 [Tuber indicum]